jgi:drug/metabolite transporter (DMT)-like permease
MAGWIRYVLGALLLAAGVIILGLSVAAAAGTLVYPTDIPPSMSLFMTVFGVIFVLLAAFLWVNAIQVTPGDHILEDKRGLFVGLMLVTTLAIGGWMLWSMTHADFWRDTIAGMMAEAD